MSLWLPAQAAAWCASFGFNLPARHVDPDGRVTYGGACPCAERGA